MVVDSVILASARKHGITDDDMLHAHRHPIRVFDLGDLDMLVGACKAACSRSASPPPRVSSSSSKPWPLDPSSWRPDMPRSIQEIFDHADELAKRFEDYKPDLADERPVEEYLLERAALARARSERQVVDAVVAARAKGVSWQRIGELLGTSAQAAHQRYGAVVEAG
jgi:hypothetical protein